MLFAVQNVVVSNDSASHMMISRAEQGEAEKDVQPMAAPFTLGDRLDALIRHFRWTPRGALSADDLGEYYFLSSVLGSVACDESGRLRRCRASRA